MSLSAIYDESTGVLVSVGTLISGPVPEGVTVLDLGDDDRLLTGYGYWDAESRTVKDVVPSPGEVDSNERILIDRIRQAITANATFLRQDTATNAQMANQVRMLTRQVNGLMRMVGRHLDDITDT